MLVKGCYCLCSLPLVSLSESADPYFCHACLKKRPERSPCLVFAAWLVKLYQVPLAVY